MIHFYSYSWERISCLMFYTLLSISCRSEYVFNLQSIFMNDFPASAWILSWIFLLFFPYGGSRIKILARPHNSNAEGRQIVNCFQHLSTNRLCRRSKKNNRYYSERTKTLTALLCKDYKCKNRLAVPLFRHTKEIQAR